MIAMHEATRRRTPKTKADLFMNDYYNLIQAATATTTTRWTATGTYNITADMWRNLVRNYRP